MAVVAKYRPLPSTKSIFGSLLDDFFNGSIADFAESDTPYVPAVNIVENRESFRIEIAAPGFEKKDFTLSVEKNQLIIGVERDVREEKQDERYTRREIRYGSFKRTFNLPETVNKEGISAVYVNGVLNITLPKKEKEKPAVKTIEIG